MATKEKHCTLPTCSEKQNIENVSLVSKKIKKERERGHVYFFLCRYYNNQWHWAQRGLEDLLAIEKPKEPLKPEKVHVHVHVHYLRECFCSRIKWQHFRKWLQCTSSIYRYLEALKSATIKYSAIRYTGIY